MALIDASASSFFNMVNAFGGVPAVHSSTEIKGGTKMTYRSPDPFADGLVELKGSGLSYSGDSPVTGTIERIQIDFFFSGAITPDIKITGLSVDVTDLIVSSGSYDKRYDAFWSTVLAGNDTIIGGSAFSFGGGLSGTGDFVKVSGVENLSGGNDTLSGVGNEQDQLVSGDAYSVVGGKLTGGNDRMEFSANNGGAHSSFTGEVYLAGDALEVSGGKVFGGKDKIFYDGAGPLSRIAGDVDHLSGGKAVGGRDIINGSSHSDVIDDLAGDTSLQDAGRTTGGDDKIKGNSFHDRIAGDVMTLNGGKVVGGNDKLFGGGGGDEIYGDVFHHLGGVIIAGGNDRIKGGGGDDSLFGQKGDDRLFGDAGNDFLDGGNNRDRLFGGDGNDVLKGGKSKDTLDGGAGLDEFVFTEVADSQGSGKDVIVGFESIDSINLLDLDAISGGGHDSFTMVSEFSGTAGELRKSSGEGNFTLFGDTTGDGAANFAVRVLVADVDETHGLIVFKALVVWSW